jgi:2-polyprenyl-3-methyl-5-hydroxy-6-metoxy-1,4-benzoquinol methylase
MSGKSLKGGKEEIVEWFKENESLNDRILDIGAGSGTYIKLIKHKEQLCSDASWVAVEAWKDYVEKYQLANKYNIVINQDARELNWSEMGQFSTAIAGDVLEHMTKDDAIKLVDNILLHCKTLIISIPIIHMPQDELDNNPFEVHVKDDWSHEEVLDTWGKYITQHHRKSIKSKIGVYWLSK